MNFAGPWPGLAMELNRAAVEPEKHFVLFGSSVLFLHGLRRKIGDIDLFVTPELYAALKLRGWEEKFPGRDNGHPEDPPLLEYGSGATEPPAHAFYAWKGRGLPINVPELIANPEFVRGWPCQDLQLLCIWKASIAHDMDRPNDWDDVAAIATFLRSR